MSNRAKATESLELVQAHLTRFMAERDFSVGEFTDIIAGMVDFVDWANVQLHDYYFEEGHTSMASMANEAHEEEQVTNTDANIDRHWVECRFSDVVQTFDELGGDEDCSDDLNEAVFEFLQGLAVIADPDRVNVRDQFSDF